MIPKHLLFTGNFAPIVGGVSTYLLHRCADPTVRVDVLAPRVPGSEEYDRKSLMTIYRYSHKDTGGFQRHFVNLMWSSSALVRRLIAVRYDRVECGLAFPHPFVLSFVGPLFNLKYTVFCHGYEILHAMRFLIPRFMLLRGLRNAELVVANSTWTRKTLLRLGVRTDRIIVIHPPHNRKLFRPFLDGKCVREKHGLENKMVIISVGRCDYRKGFQNVVKVLPEILERGIDCKYLLVSRGGEAMDEILRLIETLKIENRVIVADDVEDEELPYYYNAADIFVMPNFRAGKEDSVEGFGIVYREAGACGIPVISGIDGGVGDVVVDGENGRRVDGTDLEAIKEALIELGTNSELRRKMGARGIAMARCPADWSVLLNRTNDNH